VFENTSLSKIALPSSIGYVAPTAFPDRCQIHFLSHDFSSDFGGYSLDHYDDPCPSRNVLVNEEAILHVLASYHLDLSRFEREHEQEHEDKQDSKTRELFGTFVNLYRRKSDNFEIAIKEVTYFPSYHAEYLFESLEMLTHLKHPCIAPLFGIVFQPDLTNLKIATSYYENGSLQEVLADPPSWWTPTAKSKTIAEIVLGMRFAHSLDCAHGSLKPSNIVFDNNHNVQIVDFCLNRFHGYIVNCGELSGEYKLSGEEE
jgi:serine/threonine protein kinase